MAVGFGNINTAANCNHGGGAPTRSNKGMINIKENSHEFTFVQHKFYVSIGSLVPHCRLVELHRFLPGKARWENFHLHLQYMAQKRGGNPNAKFAWCEASKDKVVQIASNGFDVPEMPKDGGFFGFGQYLSPESRAIKSVMSSTLDESGLRQVLLCRVILGRVEEVIRGSGQHEPSSENFDSAVDNLCSPTKYIIWYPDVNKHILPLHVLSIKVDFRDRGLYNQPAIRPTSPWVPIRNLIAMLSKCVPCSTLCLVRKFHNDCMEKKITRQELAQRIRVLTGDGILEAAIKAYQQKRTAGILPSSRRSAKR